MSMQIFQTASVWKYLREAYMAFCDNFLKRELDCFFGDQHKKENGGRRLHFLQVAFRSTGLVGWMIMCV